MRLKHMPPILHMTEHNNTPAPQRGRTRRKVITVIALAVMAWGVVFHPHVGRLSR